MGVNALNSSADPICPTYGAGTISLMSGGNAATVDVGTVTTGDFLNDSTLPGGANGYTNNFSNFTCGVARVGGFNNAPANGCLSHSGFGTPPTYSSGLVSFGNTGRQS